MTGAQKRNLKNDLWGWCFAAPLVVGLLVFTLYPLVMSLIYCFFDVDVISPMSNFGLHNFREIFSGMYREDFFHSLKVTCVYTVISVPLGLVLGYCVALFLNVQQKASGAFRILFYLVALIPSFALGAVMRDMTNSQYGLFNVILHDRLGFPRIDFQSQENLLKSYIWITTFGRLAGLRGIDKTLYEAATLDGAGAFRSFFNITLPMTTPYIFYNLVTGMIGAMQLFSEPYVLTGGTGGSGDALRTLCMLIYDTAFPGHSLGAASAMAWILCAIVGVLTLFTFKSNKWVQYADEM